MNRTIVILSIASFAFTSCKNIASQEERDLKPNIVYILADDLGYGGTAQDQ